MNSKTKATTQQHHDEHTVMEVLDLRDFEPELADGYLRIRLPARDIDAHALRDFAVSVGTKQPDALTDRLYHAVRQHMVTEALADSIVPTER